MKIQKLNETFKINPLYEADGYKVGHKKMLAQGTVRLAGNWIPRSLKYMHPSIEKIMSAGQQVVVRYLHSAFQENFFNKPKEIALKFVKDMSKYLNIEYDGKHFEELYDLGYLPIEIQALGEGLFTKSNIPHMTFINTVDGYAWLTLYLETMISKLAWQLPTVATIGHKFKENAVNAVLETDKDNLWLADYMCHDFHSRGGNPFTSIVAGLGFAMSNLGGDTLNTIEASRYYYDFDENEVPIFSVNASEHSVSTTKIFTVGEKQMIIDWLKEFPTGILSIVADTFDLWQLIDYLKDPEVYNLIMSRNGKLVIRPDSGNPVDIICGTNSNILYFASNKDANDFLIDLERQDNKQIFKIKNIYYEILLDNVKEIIRDYGFDSYSQIRTDVDQLLNNGLIQEVNYKEHPSNKGVIELLWDIFGGTINEQGYKVLDPHIGAIYGDSINLDRQVEIYSRLKDKQFAATNIVVGVGLTKWPPYLEINK